MSEAPSSYQAAVRANTQTDSDLGYVARIRNGVRTDRTLTTTKDREQ